MSLMLELWAAIEGGLAGCGKKNWAEGRGKGRRFVRCGGNGGKGNERWGRDRVDMEATYCY